MKILRREAVIFIIGAVGYGLIELLWRGRTHPTMLAAGGICFLLFSHIAHLFSGKPLIFKALLSALAVTAVELAFGMVFNVAFKMKVWDYSELPLNFMGQICLLFTALWGVLGFIFVPFADFIRKRL